jgi:peptide/nickel transport system ATP-binding protein
VERNIFKPTEKHRHSRRVSKDHTHGDLRALAENTNMPLLDIRSLRMYYQTQKGLVKAVDNVSLQLEAGESLGLAGESGCGKSSLAYCVMQLLPPAANIVGGNCYFKGEDLLRKSAREMRDIRWRNVAIVFQGAMNALNPVFEIGDQIAEAILMHENVTEEEALDRCAKLFEMVGLDPGRIHNYPHEFSGGMRQRAMIAMALACNPDLVIADEPTTALDVTIQAQILKLMQKLQKDLGLSLMLITHDLSVIAETCDKVAIMYAGRIAELADVVSVFKNPIHPYATGLVGAIPSMVKAEKKTLSSIPGSPPDLIDPPTGCRFHPRCPYAQDICSKEEPSFDEIEAGRFVSCHFAAKLKGQIKLELD